MNQSEITNALEKGFGRVFLYIEKNGDESIREQVLHFCLKNFSYDTQCEDSRAEWLISLINLSKTKQPPTKVGGFKLTTESRDTRRLNDVFLRFNVKVFV